jgi:hypothetical protein
MSTTRQYDYGVWTRRNCPSLTALEQDQLCKILSVMQPSCVQLLELATSDRLHAAVLAGQMLGRSSSRPVPRSIAPATQAAIIERLSRLEFDRS